jgi:predicted glycogen debranching enzyme
VNAVPPTPPVSLVPGPRSGGTIERLAGTEWLLTDGLGGFAMGTAAGIPSRRYHGWLVASLAPPVRREVLLHSVVDRLVVAPGTSDERAFNLAAYLFHDGTMHPKGVENLVHFECDTSARWTYECGEVEVVRTLRLVRHGAAALVSWEIRGLTRLARLEVRPMLAMRDAHELLAASSAGSAFESTQEGRRFRVSHRGRTIELAGDPGFVEPGAQWWFNFRYAIETSRGLDDLEDLYSPGEFMMQVRPGAHPVTFTLSASLVEPRPKLASAPHSAAGAIASENATRARLEAMASEVLSRLAPATPQGDRAAIARLVGASDAFIVQRGSDPKTPGVSIIAGYPWFSDWGRDSMISQVGLLLVTRRFAEARRLLETFASHMKNGLVPNLFDDQTGEALYNTVDASLWYLHAACEYLRLTGDRTGFDATIRPACLKIIEAYRNGTDFKIGMDPADGLIAAGDETMQLTWMDAKRDGVVFTPRHGKAVEINALWHHGLLSIAEAIKPSDPKRAIDLGALASKAGESFRKVFWNAAAACCFDVIKPVERRSASGSGASRLAWIADPRIRPNQMFAVSLRHSPLTDAQKAAVLKVVQQHLLTPLGLRTLSPSDPGYKPRFTGRMMERDAAYHNGTVWPWLIGAYVEGLLRVTGFGIAGRAQARQELQGLIAQLDATSLGQIYEVFDGDGTPDKPRVPGGCMAQAWSIAETLRALVLINTAG